MKKRTRKILSLLLAAAMVFTTNTIAFAEEVAVDAVDETVEAEEVVVDAYEPIDGQNHINDTIAKKDYEAVPDNWGINSDPAKWPQATKLISTNGCYYDGARAWVVNNPISYFFNPVNNHLVDGQIVVPKENNEKFDDEDYQTRTANDDNVIYRVLPAGDSTFILVKVTPKGGVVGNRFEVLRWNNDKHEERVKDELNNRYSVDGKDEAIVTFSGLKKSVASYDKNGTQVDKKGEEYAFDVDAVLIKRENGKNTLVKGLSVKKVTFKNNVNASFPEEPTKDRIDSIDDKGTGTVYRNGYELTYKEWDITDVKAVGLDYKAQLTSTENQNFKGQPSFQVTFDVKGDAKAYQKEIKAAEKANKGADTTFNFEIKQLNIGDYRKDKITKVIPFTYAADADTAENLKKANEALKEKYESYVKKFADYVLKDNDEYSTITKEKEATDYVRQLMVFATGMDTDTKYLNYLDTDIMVYYDGNWHNVLANTELSTPADYDAVNKEYVGSIKFVEAPMYVDKELDATLVSENTVPNNEIDADIQLFVRKDDVKNLKFGKDGKVSAKLALATTQQAIFTQSGTSETEYTDRVGKWDTPFAYVKTTPTAGGKADVILTSQTVTDSVFGDIPFAIAQGQNDLTGAMTMRIWTDAHGNDSVRYGHYKDENNFTVSSLDD